LLLAKSPLHFVLLLLPEQNYTFQLSSFWGSGHHYSRHCAFFFCSTKNNSVHHLPIPLAQRPAQGAVTQLKLQSTILNT
jgi:hypothetical protein